MKWLIDKKTTSVLAFAFTVIVVVNALALFDLYRFRQSSGWALQTEALIAQLEETRAALLEVESAVQGYEITGDRSYLDPYLDVVPRLDEHMRDLKVLAAEHPVEARPVAELEAEIGRHLSLLHEAIRMRGAPNHDSTRPRVVTSEGEQAENRLQADFAAIRSREEGLLKQRSQDWRRSAFRTAAFLGIGRALALVVLAIAFLSTNRDVDERQTA